MCILIKRCWSKKKEMNNLTDLERKITGIVTNYRGDKAKC